MNGVEWFTVERKSLHNWGRRVISDKGGTPICFIECIPDTSTSVSVWICKKINATCFGWCGSVLLVARFVVGCCDFFALLCTLVGKLVFSVVCAIQECLMRVWSLEGLKPVLVMEVSERKSRSGLSKRDELRATLQVFDLEPWCKVDRTNFVITT